MSLGKTSLIICLSALKYCNLILIILMLWPAYFKNGFVAVGSLHSMKLTKYEIGSLKILHNNRPWNLLIGLGHGHEADEMRLWQNQSHITDDTCKNVYIKFLYYWILKYWSILYIVSMYILHSSYKIKRYTP